MPLLLGLDQPREQALMEAAYDDAASLAATGPTGRQRNSASKWRW